MKKVLFLTFILLASLTTFAQKIDSRQIPLEELKLRDTLESDASFLRMLCSIGRTNAQTSDAQKENLRVRMLLYEAIQTNDKTIKAKFTCSTKEGTKVANYIIVEKEKVKYIIDASRDEFGSLRVHSYDCGKVVIGSYGFDKDKKEMTFTALSKEELGESIPFFQCQTENRSFVF